MKKPVIISVIVIILVTLVFVSYSFFSIFNQVKITCIEAQREFKNNCINSLILTIQSSEKTFKQKNTAIWALGQLADKSALPTLQSLYTNSTPSKESLDNAISQYELRKAIKWCQQGNITKWMYRNRDSWQ